MSDEGPSASASAAGPAPAVELVVPTPYANAASKIITYLPYKIMHGKQRKAARACWRIPTRDALHIFKKLEDGGIRSSLLGGTEVVAQGQFWAHGSSSQAWSLMAAALRELAQRDPDGLGGHPQPGGNPHPPPRDVVRYGPPGAPHYQD